MNLFEAAVDKARQAGHDLEDDPVHPLAMVDRFTCKQCGRAVLGHPGNAYGSATDGPCLKKKVAVT